MIFDKNCLVLEPYSLESGAAGYKEIFQGNLTQAYAVYIQNPTRYSLVKQIEVIIKEK